MSEDNYTANVELCAAYFLAGLADPSAEQESVKYLIAALRAKTGREDAFTLCDFRAVTEAVTTRAAKLFSANIAAALDMIGTSIGVTKH
jgi:hexokinase